jgi:hypothetical protein
MSRVPSVCWDTGNVRLNLTAGAVRVSHAYQNNFQLVCAQRCALCRKFRVSHDIASTLHPTPCDAALPDMLFSSHTIRHCSVRNLRRAIAGRQAYFNLCWHPQRLKICGSSCSAVISKSLGHSDTCTGHTHKHVFHLPINLSAKHEPV